MTHKEFLSLLTELATNVLFDDTKVTWTFEDISQDDYSTLEKNGLNLKLTFNCWKTKGLFSRYIRNDGIPVYSFELTYIPSDVKWISFVVSLKAKKLEKEPKILVSKEYLGTFIEEPITFANKDFECNKEEKMKVEMRDMLAITINDNKYYFNKEGADAYQVSKVIKEIVAEINIIEEEINSIDNAVAGVSVSGTFNINQHLNNKKVELVRIVEALGELPIKDE